MKNFGLMTEKEVDESMSFVQEEMSVDVLSVNWASVIKVLIIAVSTVVC